MKRVYITGPQKDVYFDDFCRHARYMPDLKRYVISINGRTLRSTETDELFDMFMAEIKKNKNGAIKF